jgi:hypothetical protein
MIRVLVVLLLLISHARAADSPLVAAAKLYPGVRFHEGVRDPLLVQLAQTYSEQMAAINSQSKGWGRRREGHFGWDARYATIRSQLGLRGVEVSAESWDRQANASPPEIGRTMFESWRASSGHWRVVSTPHKRYGDGLAKSRRGIWFAAVIIAD